MGFFITRIFWGGLLICWGIVLILNKFLKTPIPFGRLLIAFLLIYGGVYLLTKTTKPKKVNINTTVFSTTEVFSSDNNREYNIVFGSNIVDLSDYDKTEALKVNTVFGSSTVILSSEKTYIIKANTAFGETILPLQKELWLGSGNYVIGDSGRENKIPIEINTVFGSTHVKLKISEKEEVESSVPIDEEN